MTAFESPPPNLTHQQLRDIANRLFDIQGDMKSLVSERDQNVRIQTKAGAYVLKVSNAGEDQTSLNLQNAALNHLAKHKNKLRAPRVVPSRTKQDISCVQNGEVRHRVRMLTYLDGDTFAQVAKNPALYQDVGTYLGHFTKIMQKFSHHGAQQPDFLWNLDNALSVKPMLEKIPNAENRQMLTECFDIYEDQVYPFVKSLRKSVIHNDTNDHNLVIKNGQVNGLIDFGDMVYASTVNELAIALAYVLMGADHLLETAQAVICAYIHVFPLNETEASLLFDLVALRLVMSVLISTARSLDYPDNDYLTLSQAPALQLLKAMKEIGRQSLQNTALMACGY